MDKKLAIASKKNALKAIRALHEIVLTDKFDEKEGHYEIKLGIGLAIGEIEMKILVPIYKIFPELDDLK